MNWDLILLGVFFVVLYAIYFLFKKKFQAQGMLIMYKTKFGLNLMEWFSKKCPRLLGFISWIGITLGFAGMGFMFYMLAKGVVDLVINPSAPPLVSPVLPGIEIAPGIPILSFWHWILAILIIATIHEFAHGVYARLHKVKIKSSGFAFLGPLLAAFVEPDEKQLRRKKKRKQLSVLMAGPFSNILTGFIFLGIYVLIGLLIMGNLNVEGVRIVNVQEGMPFDIAGVESGDIFTNVDGVEIVDANFISEILVNKEVGEITTFSNDNEIFEIIGISHPENKNVSYYGFAYAPFYGDAGAGVNVGIWFIELFFWLWVISFGVALFNLLPLGPVDGGRMFYLAALFFVKDEKKANKIWKAISFLTFALILANLLPWIQKLIFWLIGL